MGVPIRCVVIVIVDIVIDISVHARSVGVNNIMLREEKLVATHTKYSREKSHLELVQRTDTFIKN